MEKSTLIGVVGRYAAVGVGMALKGADPHSLINPAAFLIITPEQPRPCLQAFTMKGLKKFPKLLKLLVFRQQTNVQTGSAGILCRYG